MRAPVYIFLVSFRNTRESSDKSMNNWDSQTGFQSQSPSFVCEEVHPLPSPFDIGEYIVRYFFQSIF